MKPVRALSVAGTSIHALLVLGYPVAVYVAMRRGSPRAAATAVLLALLPPLSLRCLRSRGRENSRAVMGSSLAMLGLVALSAIMNDPRFMLAMPVLVNGALLATFALSLRGPVTIVETFARMSQGELPPAKVAYCRSVTRVWCLFFVANGLTALGLALFAPLPWWTLYTGAISYVLVGVLFAGEYAIRRYRFSARTA